MIKTIVFDFGNVLGFFDYSITTARLARHAHLSADAIRRFLYGGELEDAYESGRISSADYPFSLPPGRGRRRVCSPRRPLRDPAGARATRVKSSAGSSVSIGSVMSSSCTLTR